MKRRILSALAASALLVALTAPAFAQATATDEGDDVQYNRVCQNIIGSIGDITAGNNATAVSTAGSNATADGADDGGETEGDAEGDAGGGTGSNAEATSESVAEIAQEAGVSIEQVNECLNGAEGGNGGPGDGPTDENGDKDLPEGEDEVIDDTVKADTLPKTGGPSLLAVGVGLALVVGGAAVIRRR